MFSVRPQGDMTHPGTCFPQRLTGGFTLSPEHAPHGLKVRLTGIRPASLPLPFLFAGHIRLEAASPGLQ